MEERREQMEKTNAPGNFDFSMPQLEARVLSIDVYGKIVVGFSHDLVVVPDLELINNGTIYMDEVGSLYRTG